MTKQVILTAIITHRHGVNFYISKTIEGLNSQIAAYCRDWWEEFCPNVSLTNLTDSDIINMYFENANAAGSEYLETGTAELGD